MAARISLERRNSLEFAELYNWKAGRPAAGGATKPDQTVASDVIDVAATEGALGIFVDLLKAAGLVQTLRRPGPFTVFAPLDQAFAGLKKGVLESYFDPTNHDRLVALVTHHITIGLLPTEAMRGKTLAVANLFGDKLAIDGRGEAITVDAGTVMTPDIAARNGLVHAIDAVLWPPHQP